MYVCMIEENRTHDQIQDTRPPEKPEYICMNVDDEKKYKKVKKNLEYQIFVVSLHSETINGNNF